MTTSSSAQVSDLDKLLEALSFLRAVRSPDDILTMFGLGGIAQAQKYGIYMGICVFTITISAVGVLLVMGGSFKRIVEQSEGGGSTVPDTIEARLSRPLLLERLIEAQERMIQNYPVDTTEDLTPLTKMLINVAPDVAKAKELMACLVEEDDAKDSDDAKAKRQKQKEELKKFIPEGYEENYIYAYRRCQDQPGGSTLSGLPEARFEAYGRAYAGCGIYTSVEHRRSYARIYEAVSCNNHGNETKYREHWLERPQDIVGRTIRLEPLDPARHLNEFFDMTSGAAYKENRAYDANEVWGFNPEGPFQDPKEMRASFIFQRKQDEAGFAIVESLTDKMIGVIHLTKDDPRNLTISMELPVVKPSSEGTVEQIEGCFLLCDRLFSLGYRRIQLSVDSMDTVGKKLSGRIGFTQEGYIPKDRVVKESNRDSIVYGLLNSDWDKGARAFLFKKLHGEKAEKYDTKMNKNEDELERQQKYLAESKAAKLEKEKSGGK